MSSDQRTRWSLVYGTEPQTTDPHGACNGQRADVTPVRTQAPLRWAVTHTDSKSDRALVAVLRALTEVFTLLDSLIFPDIQTFFHSLSKFRCL